jgi:hypothetical protein
LAAALLASSAPAATLRSGLYGAVRKGPIMPVCRADVPCDAPAQVTLLFMRAGSIVARGRSDADGHYRVTIPPGYYVVRTQPRIGFGLIRPLNVHVRAAHFDRLDFLIDTGIR